MFRARVRHDDGERNRRRRTELTTGRVVGNIRTHRDVWTVYGAVVKNAENVETGDARVHAIDRRFDSGGGEA